MIEDGMIYRLKKIRLMERQIDIQIERKNIGKRKQKKEGRIDIQIKRQHVAYIDKQIKEITDRQIDRIDGINGIKKCAKYFLLSLN